MDIYVFIIIYLNITLISTSFKSFDKLHVTLIYNFDILSMNRIVS